jgi:putative DNA primase/helicase
VHCTREEYAGQAKFFPKSQAWAHRLQGRCPCGTEHAPGPLTTRRGKRKGTFDQAYKYFDADGNLCHETVRFKSPKGFAQSHPGPDGKPIWDLKGVHTFVYRLPELLAADSTRSVWFNEGEKGVERVRSLGEVATCSPMGAGKWMPQYSGWFQGRHVLIIPDNDEPGRQHAQQVARSLQGVAASVKILELPGLLPKGDVCDFLDAGGTLAQLQALADAAPEWTPSDNRPAEQPTSNNASQDEGTEINEASDDPHRLARIHLEKFRHHKEPTLRFYRGECLKWSDGAYRVIAEPELMAGLAQTIKDEFDRLNKIAIRMWEKNGGVGPDGKPCDKPLARKVTRPLVSNVTLAIQSLSVLPGKPEAPFWVGGHGRFEPSEVMPIRNALVYLPSVIFGEQVDRDNFIAQPTPRFFSTYSLDFDFNLDADPPVELIKFLVSAWPNDPESIDALQEWFGYCLTPDTRQQKIGLFIGPMRSGRGTIGRLLRALVGPENTAGPRVSALATNFGLEPLIGKPLAIIGDARISGRIDTAAIVESLLSISGEDTLTIDRKHKSPWTGKLPTRLMLLSNELPRLPDQSGALASRFLVWKFTESFLGREDHGLDSRLAAELPSILLWAIEGWRRLRDRGHFLQPKSGVELIDQVRDISSPVGVFVRERCDVDPVHQVDVAELFISWCSWCDARRAQTGNESTFGRNLRAAISSLETKQRRTSTGTVVRCYKGIRLKS